MANDALEKVVETPAIVLDKTIDASKQVFTAVSNQTSVKRASAYWKSLGPGLTTGAADDDPSGITTYSQTGARYGFQLLWLAAFTFPLMAIVQEMCARIGLVTGRGLAGNIRIHYPKWVLYTCAMLLFVANTFNVGADLGAMAKVTQLVFPGARFTLLIIGFTVFSLGFQIFTSYEKYARYLKWLALALFSYVLSALSVHLDFKQLFFSALIPSLSFSKEQILLVCGVLGTTISPYLFFWQTSQEVEEDINKGKTTVRLREGATDREVEDMRVDVWSGMFVSNLIMFFIIAASAATLFAHGITTITTANEAALALRPIAGEQAYLLFAIGIIGTGLLAVPILAGAASYALSESFRWKLGLSKTLREAPAFYGVLIISMILGLAMNFVGIDQIRALIYSAVLNGLVAPVILILIVQISSNKKIMGERVNNLATVVLGWIVTIVMVVAGVFAIFFLLVG